MSFSPLVLENEVIGAAPTYHVIRYLIIVWSGWCCTYIYHVIRYLTLFWENRSMQMSQ